VHFVYEKWEIYDFVLEGIACETRATIEYMCYIGLCSLNVDDMWDLFECLASYQWQCECASESFIYPSPPPYDLYAQSPCADQFMDLTITVLLSFMMYAHIINLLTTM